MTTGNYAQGLERALELLDYPSWRARARQQKPDEPLIGVGPATILKSSGAAGDHRVESAEVTITPAGDIVVYTGISPHGQGSETSFAQIVADELGVHPAQVRVRHSDTALFPLGEGTSVSRGLIVGRLCRLYCGAGDPSASGASRLRAARLSRRGYSFPAWACAQSPQAGGAVKLCPACGGASRTAQGSVEGERGLVTSGT